MVINSLMRDSALDSHCQLHILHDTIQYFLHTRLLRGEIAFPEKKAGYTISVDVSILCNVLGNGRKWREKILTDIGLIDQRKRLACF